MQENLKQHLKEIERTRRQIAELRTALSNRMAEIFQHHGLIEKREELQDQAVRQRCLAHPFALPTRRELEVIVQQLRSLSDGIHHLDGEINALRTRIEEENRVVYEPEPAPRAVVPIPDTYGRGELKRNSRKYLSWALGIAAAVHFLAVSVYWLNEYLHRDEDSPKSVRIYKYIELEPPPSLNEDLNQPPGGNNMLGGSTSGYLGVLGIIVPVDEKNQKKNGTEYLIDNNSLADLDRLLSQTPIQGGNGRLGEGGLGLGQGNGSNRGRSSASQADGQVVLDEFNLASIGSVDQLIADSKGVETVKLEKQGQVNIEQPGDMRGSEQAVVQRSAESVMGVIHAQQARMMYIYNKHLRLDPNMRGKINIDVTIEADGSVSNVQIADANIESPEFVRELMSLFRRLRFEPISAGAVTVNLPLVFNRTE